MAAVTALAGIVALWGILSIVVDRDPIDYPDAGPLLGPAMVVAASIVTYLAAWRIHRGWLAVTVTLLGALAAMLLVAGVGYGITRGSLEWMPRAAAHLAVAPFVPAAALLAALVVLGARAIRPEPR